MITIKQVNAKLATLGYDVELVKGNGYYYFTSKTIEFTDSMVMVNNLNSLTMDQWIAEFTEKANITSQVFYVPNREKFLASMAKIQAKIAERKNK